MEALKQMPLGCLEMFQNKDQKDLQSIQVTQSGQAEDSLI